MRWPFFTPSLPLLLLLLLHTASCQDGDEQKPKAIFQDDTAIDTLASGRTLRGVVGKNEIELLAFSLPHKRGVGFPDTTLTMEITNVAADADLYCLPWSITQHSAAVPSPALAAWRSAHTQGEDIVFISRNHSIFDTSVVKRQTEDGRVEQTADIVCSIVGHSSNPSQYAVSMDVNYDSRELVKEEQDALKEVHDSCCADGNLCLKWASSPGKKGNTSDDRNIILDFCHVLGSVCDEDGHLVRLDLQKYGLDCEMPSKAFSKMTKLKKLMLNDNFLTGDIDSIMRDLQALSDLDQVTLRRNSISGSISVSDPSEENPTCALAKQSLEFLNLEFNDVEGPLPSCLFERGSKLHVLFLDSNPIQSAIPDVFRQNSLMEYLSIADAGMFGPFPASIALIPNLVSLDLKSNALEGDLPEMLGETPYISTVSLDNNLLSGSIPSPLGSSTSLRYLGLSNNSFSEMPDIWSDPISTNDNLFQVNIANNELEGPFPLALALAPNLTILNLQDNMINGELPDTEGMFPKAISVTLSGNELVGVIPDSWGKIGMFNEKSTFLTSEPSLMDLSENMLTGPLPAFLLDEDSIPFPLSFGGINLTGNDLDCVDADEIAQMSHLHGVEECVPASTAGTVGQPAEAPSEALAESPAESPVESPVAGTGTTTLSEEEATGLSAETTSDSTTIESESSKAEDDNLTAASLTGNEVEQAPEESRKKSKSSTAKAPLAIGLVLSAIVVIAAVAAVVTVVIKRRKKHLELTSRTDVELGRSGAKAMSGVKFEAFQDG